MSKKSLSILLSFMMVISVIPSLAYADDGNDGMSLEVTAEEPDYGDEPTEEDLQEFMIEDVMMEDDEAEQPGDFVELTELESEAMGDPEELGALPDDSDFEVLYEPQEGDGINAGDFISDDELNSVEIPEDDGDSTEGYDVYDMPAEDVNEGGDVPPEEGEMPGGGEGSEELGAIDLSKFGSLTNMPSTVTVGSGGGHYSFKLTHQGKGNAYCLKTADTDGKIANVCIDYNGYLDIEGRSPGSTYVTVKLVIKALGINLITLDTAKIRIDVPDVAVSKESINITRGSAGQVSFTYSGITEKNKKVDFNMSVSNAENVDCKWSGWSGKTKKLTITGKKAGTSYIRVYLQSTSPTYYYLGGYTTIKVVVAPKPYLSLSETSLRIKNGDTKTFTATAKELTAPVVFKVASNNTSAFKVDMLSISGTTVKYGITGKALGTGTVQVNMVHLLTGSVLASANVSVTVFDNPKVTLSQSSVTVNAKSSTQITCTATGVAGSYYFAVAPSAQYSKMSAGVGSRSGNKSVITITGINAGTENLYVYLKDPSGVAMASAVLTVNVKAVANPSLKLNTKSLSVYQGSSAQIKGTMSNMPGDKKKIKVDLFDKSLCDISASWSGNSPVLTVTGKNTGSCSFTFSILRSSDDTMLASASGTINVTKPNKYVSLSYSFKNNTVTTAMKNASLKVCKYMFSGENATLVYNAYKTKYNEGVRGNCFGMSSTAGLMYVPNNGIYASTFSSSKSIVNQLAYKDKNAGLGISIGEWIQAMQICQASYDCDLNYGCSVQEYVSAVKSDLNNNKVIPVHMWWYNSEGKQVGHTVLAYGFEGVDSTHDRIFIYENNSPGNVQYINLTKDSNGNYTDWKYTYKYSNKTIQKSNATLGYTSFGMITDLWSHHGTTTTQGTLNQNKYTSSTNMVAVNSDDFEVRDVDDNVVAEVKNGKLVSENEDVGIRYINDYNEDGNDSESLTFLYMPTDVYTFENYEEDSESFFVGIADLELSAIVTTTGDEITVCADDDSDLASALILNAAKGEEYSIILGSSREGEPAEVLYEGVGTGETISVTSLNGSLESCNTETAVMSVSDEINGVSEKQIFTINASADEGGSITPEGLDRVWDGDDQEYVITPDAGYKISAVIVDGENVGAVESYSFKDVKGSHSINAVFEDDRDVKTASVGGLDDAVYTGKAIKRKPVVKMGNRMLNEGEDYTVTYKNNVNVGAASIVIKGTGAYTGTVTKTFKINPKGTSVSKLVKAKKGFSVKWKAQKSKMAKSRVTGYQVQYCLKRDFKSGVKSKTVKGYKKTALKVSKLKSKKTYYVRIRTYTKTGGKTYYSTWSKIKSVKTR